jgi:hypothetical protein
MSLLKTTREFTEGKALQLALAVISLAVTPLAMAAEISLGVVAAKHATDGGFNLHNGGSPTSEGPEWTGLNVAKSVFPVGSDGSGGAVLYVEQGPGTLYLMYDYINGTSSLKNSFFDVFFQDRVDNTDYGVRIQGNSFTAFEKPFGPSSPVNPDGSFDFSGAPWTALTQADLTLANFHGAVGFGPSPNSLTSHLLAEFDLTINSAGSGQPNGIYDPAPAFWSASCTNCSGAIGAQDPPITSGIFSLNPDGSTIVSPIFADTSGGAVQQPNEAPEPASALLLTPALVLLLLRRRRLN